MLTILEQTLSDETHTIALFGGPYSNYAAVEACLKETKGNPLFCLGDIGGFGPHPDRTVDLIRNNNITCIQGNYDFTVGHGEADCGCGYIDPRDRHFAQVSFDYTLNNTSLHHREWMKELPQMIRLHWNGKTILLCHGSPDEVNEFVWESEADDKKIVQWLTKYNVDMICSTHSGIPWIRKVDNGHWFNVGVLGRPAHDGTKNVCYGTVELKDGQLQPKLHSLSYSYEGLLTEMKKENLPTEFIEALLKGEWTTCAGILPPQEKVLAKRF